MYGHASIIWKWFKGLVAVALIAGVIAVAPPRKATAQNQVTINIAASIIKKTDKNGKIEYEGGWTPNRISVKYGQEVTINLTSMDADHDFVLPDFKVEVYIPAGQTKTVTFIANKTGIFFFHCGMECGPYHTKMVGQLVVE